MLQFKVDAEACVGCGECAADCPYMVIGMGEDGLPAVRPEREAQCIRCQHCLAVCPTGALSIMGLDPAQSRPLDGALPDADQVETLVMGRRSMRRFKDEPLDPALVERLMNAAWYAPTGVNNQGLLFTLVDGPQAMQALRERTMDGLREAVLAGSLPKGLEFFAGFVDLYDAKGVDVIYRNAPNLLVVSSPKGGPSPKEDAVIALSYFDFLAASLGLGTLWDGLAKWAMSTILPDLSRALGVPEDHELGYVMLFGAPAVRYHRTVQRGPARVNRVRALKE